MELFSPINIENFKADPYICQIYINNLNLKLFKNYEYYNYYDILISISMKYLIYIAKGEQDEIVKEFIDVNKLNKNSDIIIEDVISSLESN